MKIDLKQNYPNPFNPSTAFHYNIPESGVIELTITEAKSLIANFESIQYTLSVLASQGGTVSTEGGIYDYGTELTITATPDEGYRFDGWDGIESDENSLIIIVKDHITALKDSVAIGILTEWEEFKKYKCPPGYKKDYQKPFDIINPNKPEASDLEERIMELIDSTVNPQIASHGGNIQVVGIDADTLYIEMLGGCQGCSASQNTIQTAVDQQIKSHFPEIKQIDLNLDPVVHHG